MKVKLSPKAAPPSLGGAQLQAVADLFAVLSEPTRLRILQCLHHGPLSVGQIVDAADLRQANASKQLGILHRAGVVAREKDGNLVRYSIRLPLVYDLCSLVCAGVRQDAEARAKSLR